MAKSSARGSRAIPRTTTKPVRLPGSRPPPLGRSRLGDRRSRRKTRPVGAALDRTKVSVGSRAAPTADNAFGHPSFSFGVNLGHGICRRPWIRKHGTRRSHAFSGHRGARARHLAHPGRRAAGRRRGPTCRVYPGGDYAQYRGRYYYARSYYGPRYYHRRDSGSAVAAGVVGLAAGALIGSAIASQAQAAPPPPPARWIRSSRPIAHAGSGPTIRSRAPMSPTPARGSSAPTGFALGVFCRASRDAGVSERIACTDGPPSASRSVLPGIPRCRSAGEEIVCTDGRLRPWDAEPQGWRCQTVRLTSPSGSITCRSPGKARGRTTPPPRARPCRSPRTGPRPRPRARLRRG